jgi:hypothetical protein
MYPGGLVRQLGLWYRPARQGIEYWAPLKVYKYGFSTATPKSGSIQQIDSKKTRFLLTIQHIQTDPLPPIRSGTKVPVQPIRNDTKELRQDISRGRRVSPKNRSKAKRILFNQETEV